MEQKYSHVSLQTAWISCFLYQVLVYSFFCSTVRTEIARFIVCAVFSRCTRDLELPVPEEHYADTYYHFRSHEITLRTAHPFLRYLLLGTDIMSRWKPWDPPVLFYNSDSTDCCARLGATKPIENVDFVEVNAPSIDHLTVLYRALATYIWGQSAEIFFSLFLLLKRFTADCDPLEILNIYFLARNLYQLQNIWFEKIR